ncbi:Aspartic-type endopeptidase ctsD [Penicillium longicatenatum]|uniref:Aspartic-type endopeptidase ctsD n=1 Tax=Penicillium longicatenatum TaxID=1561947 RepID=UPI0025468896|nr:Aspartic-type endopeptidase ctsD [Penicillium longicatenatum]KAJ5635265.1 Aspartic-type endopeptidase ctsD [Penicillium longicatenatum]
MRLSSCLVVAGLSMGVNAFYPFEIKIDSTPSISTLKKVQRRFMPWTLLPDTSEEENTNAKPLTLGIKKFPVRRDNSYTIVEANTPTLPTSAPLDQDGNDYSYFSMVEVGSQKEQMWLVLDTGSPSTWVFGSDCTSSVCTSHNVFDTDNSTTYYSNSSTITVGYGSGTIKGSLGQDTLSIADMDVTLTFGQATSATSAFASYPIDGILGLGRSGTAGWTIPSFMDAVAQDGYLTSNIVGFHLSRAADDAKTGEVNFGQVDTTKFNGNISYTTTNSDIWSIPLDDVYVNGSACGFSGKSATIDTGTTYILIPPDDAATLFAMVPSSKKSGDNYIIPCDSTTTIEFEFSGIKYSISPEDYIGASSTDGCVSTIVGYQSSGADQWLVGDVFLKNVYSVFDFDNGQIGFGTLNNSTATGNGTSTTPAVTTIAGSVVTATSTAASTETSASETSSVAVLSAGSRFSFTVVPSLVVIFAAILL